MRLQDTCSDDQRHRRESCQEHGGAGRRKVYREGVRKKKGRKRKKGIKKEGRLDLEARKGMRSRRRVVV